MYSQVNLNEIRLKLIEAKENVQFDENLVKQLNDLESEV
jgi:hypothetical protein